MIVMCDAMMCGMRCVFDMHRKLPAASDYLVQALDNSLEVVYPSGVTPPASSSGSV